MVDPSVRPAHIVLLAISLVAVALAGCIGSTEDSLEQATVDPDAAADVMAWARTIPAQITGLDHLGQVDAVERAGGLFMEGDLAYVSGQNTGFYILNLTTPEQPSLIGHIPDQFTRDVDLLHYDDGRTVAATAASGQGMVFINVTDPANPEVLGTALEGTANVHNVAVVPGTHIIYNSRSLDTPGVDIVDASDPGSPEHVTTFGDLTCHDVTFYPEGERAYCPGVRETQIWDIADPKAPEVVSRIFNPAINIHHWALPAWDGKLLIIGDEFAGSTDAAAGCWAAQDLPVLPGTQSDPVGAIWFYDITDETQPTPISYVSAELSTADDTPTPCTAHFGELVPGHDSVVVGWRAAGTYLIDFTDPSAPSITDRVQHTGDNWEAKIHGGYIFTGDAEHGMDVLTFAGR